MKRKAESSGSAASRPRKRLHGPGLLLDAISEELLLNCLAYLRHHDLLAASEVNKRFNRLANDDQLWKGLFLRQFVSASRRNLSISLHSSPLFKPSQRQRTWKELFKVSHNWSTGNARTTQLSLRSSVLPSLPNTLTFDEEASTEEYKTEGAVAADLEASSPSTSSSSPKLSSSIVAWHGSYYFVAKRQPTVSQTVPSIAVHTTASAERSLVGHVFSDGLEATDPSRPLGIVEMRLDDIGYSPEKGIRLAVFYTSGQFSIFRLQGLHTSHFAYREEYFSHHVPSRPTVLARFHSPLLVTSSSDCSVRFRLLEEGEKSGEDAQEAQLSVTQSQPTMRSHMCFAPMVMKLEAVHTASSSHAKGSEYSPAARDFRVSLAYSTPYYPGDFTVGVQVFDLHVPKDSPGSLSSGPGKRGPRLDVVARNAIAVPPTLAAPTSSTSSGSVSVSGSTPPPLAVVTSIEHDGPYIVTSKSDNTISVYKVHDAYRAHPALRGIARARGAASGEEGTSAPSPTKMSAVPPLRLKHVRTLFGHTAGVDAVSVLDGRCVSTGRDGVKVWELPQSQHASSSSSIDLDTHSDASQTAVSEESAWSSNIPVREASSLGYPERLRCSWLGLDASRIVTVCEQEGNREESIRVYDFE